MVVESLVQPASADDVVWLESLVVRGPQAIIRMADGLNMTAIAEGVETVGQLNWLRKHRCRIGQGYLFSPAVEAGQAHATLVRIEAGWGRLQ